VNPDDDRPVFMPADSGAVLDVLGVRHKLTSDQTGGAYAVFDSTFDAGDGNRLHRHRRADEIGYVIEGALEVRLPDQTRVLETGGIARLPKGIPHAIRNPLSTPSRYLFIVVPGGLDRWFDAVARAHEAGTLDDATFRSLSHDHEIDWLE
jgi:quercetin dioxygenase-like cupin family protein